MLALRRAGVGLMAGRVQSPVRMGVRFDAAGIEEIRVAVRRQFEQMFPEIRSGFMQVIAEQLVGSTAQMYTSLEDLVRDFE